MNLLNDTGQDVLVLHPSGPFLLQAGADIDGLPLYDRTRLVRGETEEERGQKIGEIRQVITLSVLFLNPWVHTYGVDIPNQPDRLERIAQAVTLIVADLNRPGDGTDLAYLVQQVTQLWPDPAEADALRAQIEALLPAALEFVLVRGGIRYGREHGKLAASWRKGLLPLDREAWQDVAARWASTVALHPEAVSFYLAVFVTTAMQAQTSV